MLVTADNFSEVMTLLDQQKRLIHDTETTGLDRWHDDYIVGHAFTTPRLDGPFYLPIRHRNGTNLENHHVGHINDLLSKPDVVYTGWNNKFDVEMNLREGIPIPEKAEDVMLGAHLMNENEPSFKLKVWATQYIDPDAAEAERRMMDLIIDRGLGGKGQLADLDPSEAEEYAGQDCLLTEKGRKLLKGPLETWGLWDLWHEVNDYMLTTVRMEQRGMVLDTDLTRKLAEDAQLHKDEALAELEKLAGYAINPNSHPQMQAFTGLKSTRREILEEIREGNPYVDAVIAYRAWSRARNTYYDPYLDHVDDYGILHPNLNLNGTISGRPSASDPNMQAVPRYNKFYPIKDVFKARPGWVLVSADYSQAELRLGSYYARERAMMKLLNSGGDIHGAVSGDLGIAAKFGVDDKEARDIAKRINFGVLYGIGPKKLSRNLRVSFGEAQDFLEAYHGRYRQLRPFYRHMQFMAQYYGYIRLWTGRVRRYNTFGAQPHKALSNLVQGGVAEIMRHAILRLDQLVREGYFHMLLQVHDQILFEVPEETANECCEVIQEIMSDFPIFCQCPPRVDITIGKRWGKLEKWSPENPYKPKRKKAA